MKIEVNEDILFMAFRYALGRMTYAVTYAVHSIIDNWDKISPHNQELIHSEIIKAIADKNAGMEMDVKQWLKVLKLKPNK